MFGTELNTREKRMQMQIDFYKNLYIIYVTDIYGTQQNVFKKDTKKTALLGLSLVSLL